MVTSMMESSMVMPSVVVVVVMRIFSFVLLHYNIFLFFFFIIFFTRSTTSNGRKNVRVFLPSLFLRRYTRFLFFIECFRFFIHPILLFLNILIMHI